MAITYSSGIGAFLLVALLGANQGHPLMAFAVALFTAVVAMGAGLIAQLLLATRSKAADLTYVRIAPAQPLGSMPQPRR